MFITAYRPCVYNELITNLINTIITFFTIWLQTIIFNIFAFCLKWNVTCDIVTNTTKYVTKSFSNTNT